MEPFILHTPAWLVYLHMFILLLIAFNSWKDSNTSFSLFFSRACLLNEPTIITTKVVEKAKVWETNAFFFTCETLLALTRLAALTGGNLLISSLCKAVITTNDKGGGRWRAAQGIRCSNLFFYTRRVENPFWAVWNIWLSFTIIPGTARGHRVRREYCLLTPVIWCLMRNIMHKNTTWYTQGNPLQETPTLSKNFRKYTRLKKRLFSTGIFFLLITTQWRQFDTKVIMHPG